MYYLGDQENLDEHQCSGLKGPGTPLLGELPEMLISSTRRPLLSKYNFQKAKKGTLAPVYSMHTSSKSFMKEKQDGKAGPNLTKRNTYELGGKGKRML